MLQIDNKNLFFKEYYLQYFILEFSDYIIPEPWIGVNKKEYTQLELGTVMVAFNYYLRKNTWINLPSN